VVWVTWHRVWRAEWNFEFLGGFGYQFQDWMILALVGKELCCLDCGVVKDFVADLVVAGLNSGMGDFSLVKFWLSRKNGSKS
jgi:hypothetical protein